MKIQYVSDLHLELTPNSRYVKNIPFQVAGEVLILAGDICNLCDATPPCSEFWQWASENFREVLIVPGNHEYFHNCDILERGDSWSREILPNVHYHQNRVVRIDNVDFVFSTLWSHITPEQQSVINEQMPDFKQIVHNGNRLTPADYNAMHDRSLDFIRSSVAESTADHIVVVTHHLPSFAVVAEKHKDSALGSAFATELADFIAGSRIDVWIYGHSHFGVDATIGTTRLLSNQLGYVYFRDHLCGFDGAKFFEL